MSVDPDAARNRLRLHVELPASPPIERVCSGEPLTFGRGRDADIICADSSMSRRHARIALDADGWFVEEIDTPRNGTSLNGRRITTKTRIRHGDVIRMGGTVVRVAAEGPIESTSPDTLGQGVLGTPILRSVSEVLKEDTSELLTAGEALSRLAARLQALNSFHRALGGAISLGGLLELLLDHLFDVLRPEEGVVLLKQPDGSLRPVASRRLPGAEGELLVSQMLAQEVVEKGAGALVTDVNIDERYSTSRSLSVAGVRSILAAPFTDAAGCVGMVAVYSRTSIRQFKEEDLDLLVSLASAAALRLRNIALAEEAAARRVQDRELQLAHDMQMRMLPRRMPDRPEVDVGAALTPARAVGGDLYDYFLDGDTLWFIVADAMGKGVSAALFMAVTRALFRATAHGAAPVSAVAERMNTELARANEDYYYVTAVVGRLELRSGELTYCRAGHPAPLRATRAGPCGELAVIEGGTPLGLFDGTTYEEGRVSLEPGEVLLLFSDGVADATRSDGESFTEARLARTFRECSAKPAPEIVRTIFDAVSSFAAGAPQADDITVLALRFVGRT